ncbi:cell wall anchor protein [Nonomuraea terrae]|uniref:Cell wall anchor protein n=1 Tax=Nonomuraea terrae TaxID=2530383 RepID=A0A4R4ZCV8_9ACTN|nr:cell wall anchor protein [Nonomuraea terrae]TDD56243.1 cell wall anchor protein [Nonomuraea terrae]
MHIRNFARTGTAALLTAAAGFAVASAPAYAADEPSISVMFNSVSLANNVAQAHAKPFQILLRNDGADAKGITVTVGVDDLDKTRVGYVVPDGCTANAGGYTCRLPDMPSGTTQSFGAPLYSRGVEGTAGTVSVKVSAPSDPEYDNSAAVPVIVREAGYDLVAWAQDGHSKPVLDGDDAGETDLPSIKPGHSAPLDLAIYNYGSLPFKGALTYSIHLPTGTIFTRKPAGCTTEDVAGEIYASCKTPDVVLEPGAHYAPRGFDVQVARDVTSPVLADGTFYVPDPTLADVDPADAATTFEVYAAVAGGA